MEKKYTDVGERLKIIRGKENQDEFSRKLDISKAALQNYEAGLRLPPGKVLQKVADIGHTTADWVLTGLGLEKAREFIKTIPLLALAGAGTPKELFEAEAIGFVAIPEWKFKPSLTALKVAGESMAPTIKDGAEVVVDRAVGELVDGRIYVVYIRDNGLVIKRLYKGPGVIILRSDNPASPELVCRPEEIEIQGRIVGVYQDI